MRQGRERGSWCLRGRRYSGIRRGWYGCAIRGGRYRDREWFLSRSRWRRGLYRGRGLYRLSLDLCRYCGRRCWSARGSCAGRFCLRRNCAEAIRGFFSLFRLDIHGRCRACAWALDYVLGSFYGYLSSMSAHSSRAAGFARPSLKRSSFTCRGEGAITYRSSTLSLRLAPATHSVLRPPSLCDKRSHSEKILIGQGFWRTRVGDT